MSESSIRWRPVSASGGSSPEREGGDLGRADLAQRFSSDVERPGFGLVVVARFGRESARDHRHLVGASVRYRSGRSRGARAVKEHGGTLIIQDETTSEFFGMPGAAIDATEPDLILRPSTGGHRSHPSMPRRGTHVALKPERNRLLAHIRQGS